jgi:hypothetical protein
VYIIIRGKGYLQYGNCNKAEKNLYVGHDITIHRLIEQPRKVHNSCRQLSTSDIQYNLAHIQAIQACQRAIYYYGMEYMGSLREARNEIQRSFDGSHPLL